MMCSKLGPNSKQREDWKGGAPRGQDGGQILDGLTWLPPPFKVLFPVAIPGPSLRQGCLFRLLLLLFAIKQPAEKEEKGFFRGYLPTLPLF